VFNVYLYAINHYRLTVKLLLFDICK